jgi:hypothetical protein
VPLEELREINFTKQYGIAKDPEVIDILETASKTKGVFMLFFLVFLLQEKSVRKYIRSTDADLDIRHYTDTDNNMRKKE